MVLRHKDGVAKRRGLKKAARERKVFREASAVAGLQVKPKSLRSRRHPEPDIAWTE